MTLQHIDRPITIRASRSDSGPGDDFLRLSGKAAVRFLSRYGVLVGFLALWQVGSSVGWVNAAVLPPIDMIIAALWKGLAGGSLLSDIAISLHRAGISFASSGSFAIPLGLFMGQLRPV